MGREVTTSGWPRSIVDRTDAYPLGTILKEKGKDGDKKHDMRKTNFVRLVYNVENGQGGRGTDFRAYSVWKRANDESRGEYLRLGSGDKFRHTHINDLSNLSSYPTKTIKEYAAYKTQRKAEDKAAIGEGIQGIFIEDGATAAQQAYYDSFGAGLGVLNFGTTGTTGGGGGGGGGGRGGRGGASTQTSTAYELDSVVKLIVRMPIGYAGVAKSTSRNPGFIQTWREEDGKTYTEEFLFRYIPQNIKYDGLSSEWIEIPRAENIPFVDWSRWPLMKVSMSFLIASDRVEPGGQTVPDGMSTAVEPQIQKLRQMAQRKSPITFINMDELLTVQLRRGKELGRGLEFVINDMSVSATRRVTDFSNGGASIPSGISVAQVEMTFTEIPVERVSLVYLSSIGTPDIPPPGKDRPNNGKPLEYGLFTDIVLGGANRVDTVYTDDAAVS